MAKDQHVVPRGGQWAIREAGNKTDTGVYPTQREAITRAREIAKNQGSELVIHGSNGQIQEQSSYGMVDLLRWPVRESVRRQIVPIAYYLEARKGFRSDAALAKALGVSAETITRWKRGGTVEPESERLLRDLAVAVSELLTAYEPEAVPEWLQGRAPREQKTPLEWLREGNLAEVLNQINASATGAYS